MTTEPRDPLAFLETREPQAPAAPDAAAAPAVADPSNTDQPRRADGTFAPKSEATPPVAPAAAPAAPVAPTPPAAAPAAPAAAAPAAAPEAMVSDGQGGMVPLASLLDERDKRQKAEARAAALEAQRAPAPVVQRPDPTEDPAGALAYDQESQRVEFYNYRLNTSRRFAERQYGAEQVQAVHEWANARTEPSSPDFDPRFNAEVAASQDPYETIMQAYNRDRVLTTVTPDKLDAFQKWLAETGQGGAPAPSAGAPAAPATPPQPAPVPRSINAAPAAGGPLKGKSADAEPGPGHAYDRAFGR